MKPWYIILGVVAVIGLILVGSYTSLVGKDEAVKAKTGMLQSTYQRRLDLIPNLVEVVKKYAEHEKAIFTEVANARARVAQVNVPSLPSNVEAQKEYVAANQALSGSLSRLIAVAENYPTLKADGVFTGLQSQIEGTENRINTARNDREKAVQEYNSARRGIPGKLVQIFSTFPEAQNYESTPGAEKAPTVKF